MFNVISSDYIYPLMLVAFIGAGYVLRVLSR